MSQENVETVRCAYEAWNAGDMDALREFYDPRAIIVPRFEGWPEGTEPSVGRDAVIRLYEYARQTWDADSMEPISLDDAGDSVVVRTMWRGTGHGPDFNMEWTIVFTLRKGKIFLLEQFWDHGEALEAAGLSSPDAQRSTAKPK
jgi:ketosteroid isomerase-like protein